MTLYVPTSSVGGVHPSVTQYLDISQVVSLVNRRFYRQGLNWAVAGIKVLSQSGYIGTITVSKLPNTWAMSNAWEKGMRSWRKMISEASDESPSIRPRFLDYKIYADDEHHAAGVWANMLPASLGGMFTVGEWDYSTYEIPVSNADPTLPAGNTVTRDVVAVGPNYTAVSPATGNYAVSLIEGYASGRSLPNVVDPNMPDDAVDASGSAAENWAQALFNEGTQQDAEVLSDLETQNSRAPYPFEDDGVHVDTMYPNGANQATGLEIHTVEFITPTTIGGTTRLKGGNFPCGLIRFDLTNQGETGNLVLEIDLVPGNHRGYLCEPMTEM